MKQPELKNEVVALKVLRYLAGERSTLPTDLSKEEIAALLERMKALSYKTILADILVNVQGDFKQNDKELPTDE